MGAPAGSYRRYAKCCRSSGRGAFTKVVWARWRGLDGHRTRKATGTGGTLNAGAFGGYPGMMKDYFWLDV